MKSIIFVLFLILPASAQAGPCGFVKLYLVKVSASNSQEDNIAQFRNFCGSTRPRVSNPSCGFNPRFSGSQFVRELPSDEEGEPFLRLYEVTCEYGGA